MASNFPNDWKLMPFEDCMEAIIDYRGVTPKKSPSGFPLITAKIIKGGRLLDVNEYIPADNFDAWMRRGLPEPGDVVMTTEAPLGEIAQLDDRKVALAQRLITLRGKPGLLDNTFLKFLMMSRYIQNQLMARSTGTTVLGIKQSELRKITLVIPPLPTQRLIASVLASLDDKIELNRRMNSTLEALAAALFKHWFVDNSEAEKWEVRKIGGICEFAYGKGLKEDQRKDGLVPVYGSNGRVGWHNEFLTKGPGIVIGRKGNPGTVTWVEDNFFPIDTTFYIVPKDNISLYWLHYALLHENLSNLSADSAVPGLNRNIAYMSDVFVPPIPRMKAFEEIVIPIFKKIYANEEQSRTLAVLRDTLLPKLMRGEVRVKDVLV
jgi:type I restriction enzyme S subunit